MAKKSKVLSKNKGVKSGTKGKPKDFAKVKNKVGKQKQKPTNEMKTDVKVKKVQMPAQHALDEKGEEVTHRRLGMVELLGQLQHHSPKVRRDALRGLLELCREHPGVLNVNLARILDSTVVVATDGSPDVRAALRSFQAFLLEAMPQDAVSAFAPTLALQVRSALSHVSGEVREDGLKLLELYLSRLGSEQVLSQNEASRLVGTLCQLHSHVDLVLPCLLQLLQCKSEAVPENVSQASLYDILDGKLQQQGQAEVQADSQIWDFCLRAWMQAGELPRGAANAIRGPHGTLGRPGWMRLRAAAVLEQASAGVLAGHRSARSFSQPSASQVATLSGIVRRAEWPIQVDPASPFRQLADSINLRMARVFALLAAGAAPADASPTHLQRLASAALTAVEQLGKGGARSLANNGRGLGPEAAASAVASIALAEDSQVKPFSATASLCHCFRVLDHLWCGFSSFQSLDADVGRLAEVTSALSSGTGKNEEELAPTTAAMLAIPLTASLIGLQPEPIPCLGRVWPEALSRREGLATTIEEARPGTVLRWATTWPKMLWYLGSSQPQLTGFLLAVLLKLAKAAKPGSIHETLLASTLPLLVPFVAGMPGEEKPPPLARLPADVQLSAAALLLHFPRFTFRLVTAVAELLCRWSEAAADNAAWPDARLSTDCCELLLEAVLRGHPQTSELLVSRLRAALAILKAPSSSSGSDAGSELSVKLATAVAGWVMEVSETSASEERSLGRPVSRCSADHRRHLAFRSLAWPLCKEVCCAGARALCFFYFSARHLPEARDAEPEGTLFMREVFETLVVSHGQEVFKPKGLSVPGCKPLRGEGADQRHLPHLFVFAWMRAYPQQAAYELLAPCAQQLLGSKGAHLAHLPWVLAEAISYRNACSIRTDSWGKQGLGDFTHRLAPASPMEVRKQLEALHIDALSAQHFLAALPLL
ncbi:unnamed protein product [Effrenium voratum]|uniref:Pre-rRNA-processing protein Ipi1 N-terminal domain-containing protein n=1 Tax=Effrenium voratum TaxID=2562239 RepID=A0AA36I4R5_9DINO|nr:unnamed protein product [Effrenium voratum]